MRKLTDFGLAVKVALLEQGRTQKSLEDEVSRMTGMFIDHGYMYKILSGSRKAPKVVEAIKEVLNLKGGV